MGFLDHTTNNIIVDAVLTDVGRQRLARNDGSFQVYKFALADDEVDYNIIKQFGRTVGIEKIIKNTPVMEGFTQAGLGQKYKLTTVNNDYLTTFPSISIKNNNSDIYSVNRTEKSVIDISLEIKDNTGISIADDLADFIVMVEVDTRFLRIVGQTPSVIRNNGIAIYKLRTIRTRTGGFEINFSAAVKSFTNKTFNTFSIAGSSYIRSFIKVRGFSSGVTKNIEIQISNT